MELRIKGLKHMDGPDSLIFRCSVYVDGKRRFVARNDGNGGCHAYDPINDDSYNWIRMTERWAKTLPDREVSLGYDGKTMTIESELDAVIDDLVFAEIDRRWLKTQCRTKTLFRTTDMPVDEWRTIDHKFNDDVRAWILQKHPDAVIVNETVWNHRGGLTKEEAHEDDARAGRGAFRGHPPGCRAKRPELQGHADAHGHDNADSDRNADAHHHADA